jgi:hypothetical protein
MKIAATCPDRAEECDRSPAFFGNPNERQPKALRGRASARRIERHHFAVTGVSRHVPAHLPLGVASDDKIATIRNTILGPLCTDAQLAIAMNVSTRTIHCLVARGMPVVRIGRNRLFNPAVVGPWMALNCQSAKAA